MDAQAFTHSTLEKLARWAIYGMFFLVPVVFCSQTIDPFEINKQLVLLVLSGVALLGWLAHMVLSQELRIRSGWLNVLPVFYLVAVIVSGVFSLAGFQTWLGGAMQEYASVLTTATLVLLFYALSNTVGRLVSVRGIVFALLLSASVSGLLSLLSMLNLYHLPFGFAAGKGFSTVGSLNLFAIFELTIMLLGLTVWTIFPVVDGQALLGGRLGPVLRACIVFVTAVALITLLAIDFWVLWALAIFGVLLLMSVGFMKGEELPQPSRFVMPFVVLILSILFFILPSPLRLELPVTVSPSYGSGWDIARATLSQGTQRVLTGSGPGTFIYDFAQYKSADVNETIFWNTLFDRAKSHALTSLATTGVFATTVWVLFLLMLGLQVIGRLAFERHLGDWKILYAFFVPWSVLVLAHLLYSSNMTLTFLLWALSGVLASQVLLRERSANFAAAPRLALLTSFAFVLVAVATVGALVLSGQRYAGELAFYRAVEKDRAHVPVTEMLNDLISAVRTNTILPYDAYLRNLSAVHFALARAFVSQADAQPTQEQLQQISQTVSAAVEAGRAAVEAGPNNVANWVVLGSVYRDVMPFVSGAEDFAAATFQRAIALEPVNPLHHTNLARVHMAVADRARQLKGSEDPELATQAAEAETTQWEAAEASLKKAIELKPDFAPAHYYLAAVYERQGRLEEAAGGLLALTRYRPTDIGLGFQLAMLYIRMEQLDAARAELERIVGLNPQYSNALWYLSAMYETQGNAQKALEFARRVLELNPDNEAAQSRVQALEAGSSMPEELPVPVEEGEGEVVTE